MIIRGFSKAVLILLFLKVFFPLMAMEEKDSNTRLIDAIERGSAEDLVHALSLGASPNTRHQKSGKAALVFALSRLKTQPINQVISLVKIFIAQEDLDPQTLQAALFSAVSSGQPLLLQALIESCHGLVNTVDGLSNSLLHRASALGNQDVVKILVDLGANVNTIGQFNHTPLHVAAEAASLPIVDLLLHSGAQVNAIGRARETALHYAVARGNAGLVEILLAAGADINAKIEGDYTPLHIAVELGYEDIVKILTSRGADIRAVDEHGLVPSDLASLAQPSSTNPISRHLLSFNTLTRAALERGVNVQALFLRAITQANREDVKDALKAGACPNELCEELNVSSLVLAIRLVGLLGAEQMLPIIKLIAQSSSFDSKTLSKAIFEAISQGDSRVLQKLFRLGNVDVNLSDGRCTFLEKAIRAGSPEIVSLLLRLGADPNILCKNSVGGSGTTSPLFLAVAEGRLDIVKILIDAGADPSFISSNSKKSLLEEAIPRYQYYDRSDIVKILIDAGVDSSFINSNSKENSLKTAREIIAMLIKVSSQENISNALCSAAEIGNIEIMQMLIVTGADVNVCTSETYDITPLYEAISRNRLEAVKLLISHGANVNARNGVALRRAVDGRQCADIVRELLAAGVQVNITYSSFYSLNTPLHYAAAHGDLETVTLLVEAGANLDARNNDGDTPEDRAIANNHYRVAAYLLKQRLAQGLTIKHTSGSLDHLLFS